MAELSPDNAHSVMYDTEATATSYTVASGGNGQPLADRETVLSLAPAAPSERCLVPSERLLWPLLLRLAGFLGLSRIVRSAGLAHGCSPFLNALSYVEYK